AQTPPARLGGGASDQKARGRSGSPTSGGPLARAYRPLLLGGTGPSKSGVSWPTQPLMKKGIDRPTKTNPLPKLLVAGWDRCSALERSQPLGLARTLDGARSLLWLPASHYIWGVRTAGCPNRSWCPDPAVLSTPAG